MNYIDSIARAICRAEDASYEPNDSDMDLYRLYALLALAKGPQTTDKDVHDAWSAWMSALDPYHRSLIPFDELDEAVQRLDDPYVEAIHKVAATL